MMQRKQSYHLYWLQDGVWPDKEVQVQHSSIFGLQPIIPHIPCSYPPIAEGRRSTGYSQLPHEQDGIPLRVSVPPARRKVLRWTPDESPWVYAMGSINVTDERTAPCSWHAPKSP